MHRLLLISVMGLGLISACAKPAPEPSAEEICKGFGYKAATPDYRKCVYDEQQARENEARLRSISNAQEEARIQGLMNEWRSDTNPIINRSKSAQKLRRW